MTAALSAPLTWALPAAILLLALAMVLTLLRMLHGPTAQDRVLALDCMYFVVDGKLDVVLAGSSASPQKKSASASPCPSRTPTSMKIAPASGQAAAAVR